AVSEQLVRGICVEDLMGGRTDALKLVSSLTLFRAAAEQLEQEAPTFAPLAHRLVVLLGQTASKIILRAISRSLGSIASGVTNTSAAMFLTVSCFLRSS